MIHTTSENAIKGIESILKGIMSEQDKTNKEIDKVWHDSMLAQDYKENRRAELNGRFELYTSEQADKLLNHTITILEAEAELEKTAIDVNDSTVNNAISFVSSMGEALPLEQQKAIAEQFRGNYPVEKCLTSLYSKIGLTYNIELTNYERLYGELRMAINNFNSSKEKAAAHYRSIEVAANKLLESFNSDYRMELGISDIAFMEYVRIGAGL